MALVLLMIPSAATAAPCTSDQPEAGAPVRVPLGPANFGVVPEACGVHELSLRGRMGVLIAEDDFYGQLNLGADLMGRFVLPGGSWISAQLPGFEYRFVANATVEAESTGTSASTLGWHVPIQWTDSVQLAPYFRTMLPSESVFVHAHRYGFEQGIAFVSNIMPWFEVMGGYAMPLLLTTNFGTTKPLLMPTLSVDAGFRPWSWFEGVVGLSTRIVPADDEPFESADPRVALRFYPWGRMLIDVFGAFPLLGRDRTNVAVGLTLGLLLSEDDD
jgi:hypothetical protein